jgi:hypothetical protein
MKILPMESGSKPKHPMNISADNYWGKQDCRSRKNTAASKLFDEYKPGLESPLPHVDGKNLY